MKKNLGNADRIIRVLLALAFGALYLTGTVTGTAGIILLVLGIVFLGTSFISWCPIYAALGLKTCPVPPKP